MGIEGLDDRVVRLSVCGVIDIGGDDIRLVPIPSDILKDLPRIGSESRACDLIDRCLLLSGADRFRLGRIAQQLIDFMMKDQRQAGQAKQQQENR